MAKINSGVGKIKFVAKTVIGGLALGQLGKLGSLLQAGWDYSDLYQAGNNRDLIFKILMDRLKPDGIAQGQEKKLLERIYDALKKEAKKYEQSGTENALQEYKEGSRECHSACNMFWKWNFLEGGSYSISCGYICTTKNS